MKQHPLLFSKPMIEAIINGHKTQTRRIIKPQPVVDVDSGRVFDGGARRSPYDIHNWLEPYVDSLSVWKPGDLLYVREAWQMAMWYFEDDEVRIRYEDGVEITFPLPSTDDPKVYDKAHDWMVREFEKLLSEDIIAPETEDESPIIFTGKKHPFSPSIHLPKWCSRIWLKVRSVRVEQLQQISSEDAIAEGIEARDHLADTVYPDYNGFTRRGFFIKGSDYGYNHGKETQSAEVASFCTLWHLINGKESWDNNPWVWVIEFEVESTEGISEEEKETL